jgi:3-oxoacyl-[acyl-carrier-protein] synthase II
MKKRRVAITGLGVVSPLGNDVQTTWNNLLAGRSGIDHIKQFDASAFPTHIAAEVKNFTLAPEFLTKHNRHVMSFTGYALAAAAEAFVDAGIKPTDSSAKRWGVVTGSGMMTAEFEYLQRFQKACAREGEVDWTRLQASSDDFYQLTDFGKTVSNTGLSLLIQQFGIQGHASSVHTACASGGQALGLAMQVIRRGDADFMLAGGFDSMINPLGLSSFCLLGALSTYNDTPTTASRPFDGTRNGFVLGEGAAFLILEEWSKAKARGAHIYAELAGEGNTLSSYHRFSSEWCWCYPSNYGCIKRCRR